MNFAERKIFEVTGIMRKSRVSKIIQTFLESNKLLSHVPEDPVSSDISYKHPFYSINFGNVLYRAFPIFVKTAHLQKFR